MKDLQDKKTKELFNVPAKRGRPSTGKALTSAERKRAQRLRDYQQTVSADRSQDLSGISISGLLEGLANAVSSKKHARAKALAAELVKRSK